MAHGKKSRSRNRLKRVQEKRRKKEAKKLLYKQYASMGRSKRSQRERRKQTRLAGERGPHIRPCGNIACKTCYAEWHDYLKTLK